MTGPNSNKHWYLSISGIELYGSMIDASSDSAISDKLAPQNWWDQADIPAAVAEFQGQSRDTPTTVIHLATNNKWQGFMSVNSYSSGRQSFEVKFEVDPPTTNTWRFIVGIVPPKFTSTAPKKYVGSKGWGYIAGTGGKNHNSGQSAKYGDKYGAGDIIRVAMDFEAQTVEFFKNGISQSVSFRDLAGPVHAAVSMTGAGTMATLMVRADSAELSGSRRSAPSASQWLRRTRRAHLADAAVAWFKHNRRDVGTRGRPAPRLTLPSVEEMSMYNNQFMWVLLRCVKSDNVRRIIAQPEWTKLLVQTCHNGSSIGRVLSLRILRHTLPSTPPKTADAAVGPAGFLTGALREIGAACLQSIDTARMFEVGTDARARSSSEYTSSSEASVWEEKVAEDDIPRHLFGMQSRRAIGSELLSLCRTLMRSDLWREIISATLLRSLALLTDIHPKFQLIHQRMELIMSNIPVRESSEQSVIFLSDAGEATDAGDIGTEVLALPVSARTPVGEGVSGPERKDAGFDGSSRPPAKPIEAFVEKKENDGESDYTQFMSDIDIPSLHNLGGDVEMLVASLAILEGGIERVREGAAVLVHVEGDVQGGVITKINTSGDRSQKDSKKTWAFHVQLSDGEDIEVLDKSQIEVVSETGTDLSRLTNADDIFRSVVDFLETNDSAADSFTDFPDGQILLAQLTRYCTRVVEQFVRDPKFVSNSQSSCLIQYLSKRALVLQDENIGLDGPEYTVFNVQSRLCMLDDVRVKRQLEVRLKKSSAQMVSEKSDFKEKSEFSHDYPMDTNGILYYLGTDCGRSEWKNPHDRYSVTVTCRSLMKDSKNASAIVGRESVRCVSKPEDNQWFQVDFHKREIRPRHYTLRHYQSWDTEDIAALRNWRFEGWANGKWSLLREHTDDQSLNKKGMSYTWTLEPAPTAFYSKFRVAMTGKNSNGHMYLSLSGFELYGTMRTISRRKGSTASDIQPSSSELSSEPGTIFSFGKSENGRVGHGDTPEIAVPSAIIGFEGEGIAEVGCFASHVIALTESGKVYTWGKGDNGRLGHGNAVQQSHPKRVRIGKDDISCVRVSAGLGFSVALDSDGKVWTFGQGSSGQIGNGANNDQKTPVMVQGILEDKRISTIAAGGSHVLAVSSGGQLYAWGKNQYGQLGLGSIGNKDEPVLVDSAVALSFVMLCAGWEHSMALTAKGALYTWGGGYEGSRPVCGHGTNEKQLLPRQVEPLKNYVIVRMATGWDHSLVVTSEGHLFTWGGNPGGCLGESDCTKRFAPKRVTGDLVAERVVWADGGQDHTCAVTEKGELFSWGSGGKHLGHMDTKASSSPKRIESTVGKQIFQAVTCGDKCNFAITSVECKRVPYLPLSALSKTDKPLPPYPYCAFFVGGCALARERKYAYFRPAPRSVPPGDGVLYARDNVCSGRDVVGVVTSAEGTGKIQSDGGVSLRLSTALGVSLPPCEGDGPISASYTATVSIKPTLDVNVKEVVLLMGEHENWLHRLKINTNFTQISLEVRYNTAEASDAGAGALSPLSAGALVGGIVGAAAIGSGENVQKVTAEVNDFAPEQYTAICLVFDAEKRQLKAFVEGILVCEIQICGDAVDLSNGSRLTFVKHLMGCVKQAGLWYFALTNKQVSHLGANGLEFVGQDFQADLSHRRAMQFLNFGAGERHPDCSTVGPAAFKQVRVVGAAPKGKSSAGTAEHEVQMETFFSIEKGTYIAVNRVCEASETPETRLNVYSLIMDIKLPKLPALGTRLSLFQPASKAAFFVDHTGALRLEDYPFGTGARMQADRWHRVCFVVNLEAGRAAVYLDGQNAFALSSVAESAAGTGTARPELKADGPLAIAKRYSMFYHKTPTAGCEVRLRAIRLQRAAVSTAVAMKLGASTLHNPLTDEREIRTLGATLVQMGHPIKWIEKAFKHCGKDRRLASDWILANQKQLENEDFYRNHMDSARRLTLMGYPLQWCIEALGPKNCSDLSSATSEGSDVPLVQPKQVDFERAVSWLLDNEERLMKRDKHRQSTTSHPPLDSSVHLKLFRQINVDSGDSLNNGHRILADVNQKIDFNFNNATKQAPAERIVEFADTDEISAENANSQTLRCERFLATVYAREALVSLFRHWRPGADIPLQLDFPDPSPVTPSPSDPPRLSQLGRFLRLVAANRVGGGLEALRPSLLRIVRHEAESVAAVWNPDEPLAMSEFTRLAPVSRHLINQVLVHLIGLCQFSSMDSAARGSNGLTGEDSSAGGDGLVFCDAAAEPPSKGSD
eukprot:709582_1